MVQLFKTIFVHLTMYLTHCMKHYLEHGHFVGMPMIFPVITLMEHLMGELPRELIDLEKTTIAIFLMGNH